MKRWLAFFRKHRRQVITYSLLILLLVLLISLLLDVIRMALIILLFAGANCVLRFYRRVFPGLPLELEVTIFATVLVTHVYGLWAGITTALLASLSAEFFNQYLSPYSMINVIIYALVPFFAFFIPASGIALFGFLLALLANVVLFIIFFALGYDLFKNIAYSVTDVFFNYLFFTTLGAPFLAILIP